ncbi:MAG: flagellar hook protein FlgE [Lachnospiraceae bacterium]|nr:flagellar hook protein FlgE [Lachnospiraceae bacterium]
MTDEMKKDTAPIRRSLIMMRSLYSGVSGLKVHQTGMDVIGNNIANVNTVGFKSQRATFSELFYQTTQSASGPNAATSTGGQNAKQIGLGSNVAQISVNITNEGGSQSTGNDTDLKINGQEFFIVQKGGADYYTKAGNFTTDGFGSLVTGSGGYVMGYTAQRDPVTGDFVLMTDELRPLSLYGEEYMLTAPNQTTAAKMTGNINSSDEDFTTDGLRYKTTDMYVYDSLGNTYNIQFRIEQVPGSTTDYTLSINKIFSGTDEVTHLVAQFNEGVTSIPIKFDATKGTVSTDTPKNFTLSINNGTDGALAPTFQNKITVDLGDMTNYGSDYSVVANKGDGTIQNQGAGKAVGKMISVAIQTDGKIISSYDNGDTLCIGQIAVASFANAAGLEKIGDNLFASTLNSGMANVNDVTAFGDDMSSGVLEMSNVDLATEFTNMIVTQRGYQANSRVITTSDTMIEELLNLKR